MRKHSEGMLYKLHGGIDDKDQNDMEKREERERKREKVQREREGVEEKIT